WPHSGCVPTSAKRSTSFPRLDCRGSWPSSGATRSSRAISRSGWGRSSYAARSTHLPSFKGKRRSEEHTSELQSHLNLVCRLLLEKKKKKQTSNDKRTTRHSPHLTEPQ